MTFYLYLKELQDKSPDQFVIENSIISGKYRLIDQNHQIYVPVSGYLDDPPTRGILYGTQNLVEVGSQDLYRFPDSVKIFEKENAEEPAFLHFCQIDDAEKYYHHQLYMID